MTDALDPASMVEAAQKAVGDGDYLAAERLLREAAEIQEANLGSSNPDLASTLNNLAFVYERTNNVAEAERGYRRAHAIAVSSLSPGHPLIATSLKNLVEFCAAHQIPIWKPPVARPDDETPLDDFADEPSDDVAAEQREVASALDVQEEPAVVTGRLTPRMIAVAALVIAVVVAVAFIRRSPETTNTPGLVPETRQESSSSAAPEVSKPIPAPPRQSEPPVARAQPPETPKTPEATKTPTTKAPPTKAAVTVLSAQLCSALAKRGSPDWQCTPANGDLRPGTYFFYTRLLTTANTTVEHRWYRDDRVHQVMRLRVSASPSTGYRTFSGNTVRPERAGEWKVELRASDGSVLHEERFVVR